MLQCEGTTDAAKALALMSLLTWSQLSAQHNRVDLLLTGITDGMHVC